MKKLFIIVMLMLAMAAQAEQTSSRSAVSEQAQTALVYSQLSTSCSHSLFAVLYWLTNLLYAPREATGGAAGTVHEVVARVPFQYGLVGAERPL